MKTPLLFLAPLPLPKFQPHRSSSRRRVVPPRASLILGLNQYTHDASVAIIHAATGQLLYAQSKERLTRRKHDGGDLSSLIKHALQSISASLEDVQLVVANNHHFRIAPFESRLPFSVSLGYHPQSLLCPYNLVGSSSSKFPNQTKIELSHHLAHAYAAVYRAPFDIGVVLVMDGMGDALDDWLVAGSPAKSSNQRSTINDMNYYTEETVCQDAPYFQEFPRDIRSRAGASFREAETAYMFKRKNGRVQFTRIFKRWTRELAPPELPNHSFEEMESVGAMYSRVSAILFKDWNACGKVMGLAPYSKSRQNGYERRSYGQRYFIEGNIFDGTLEVGEGQLKGLEHVHKSISDCDNTSASCDLRLYFEDLACRVQEDLEDVVLNFASKLMDLTGEENLVFAGGVALNSSVNGKLSEHAKIRRLYVPPFPGDEGVSLGCAFFGHDSFSETSVKHAQLKQSFMPYLGKQYTEAEMMSAIKHFSPWINWRREDSIEATAKALAESKVVAWFNGRSEFGPRALGCRSILADPRNASMLDHLNQVVKKREAFRPFAPTVLAEFAVDWFQDCSAHCSPYMSLTKRSKKPEHIPAVVHVDGTSRLQTLSRHENPAYYKMISRFHEMTGVPMVLNTSFNVAGEPIVESPSDALKTFLASDGIHNLVFPGIVVEKDIVTSLSGEDIVSTACATFRSEQVQDSLGQSLRTKVVYVPKESDDSCLEDYTEECTVELEDGLQLAILELVQEHGSCTVSSILREFRPVGVDADEVSDASVPDLPSAHELHDRISNLCNLRLAWRER